MQGYSASKMTNPFSGGGGGGGMSIGASIGGSPNASSLLFVAASGGTLDQSTSLLADKANTRVGIGATPDMGLHVRKSGLGTSPSDGIKLDNTTAATSSSAIEHSPGITFIGQGWKTSGGAASQTHTSRIAAQSGVNGSGALVAWVGLKHDVNGSNFGVNGSMYFGSNGMVQFGGTAATGIPGIGASNSGGALTLIAGAGNQIFYQSNDHYFMDTSGTSAWQFEASNARILFKAGTAPSGNPGSTEIYVWSNSGHLAYRSGTTSEGAGQTNRVHNRGEEVTGVGTDYSFTNTLGAVAFGTTSPSITLPTAGTYLLMGMLAIANGATPNDSYEYQFHNTTDTAAIGPTYVESNLVASAETDVAFQSLVTVTATKTVTIRARNATAARGTAISTRTKITYVRLS